MASTKRIMDLINTPIKIKDNDNSLQVNELDSDIIFKDVSFSYNESSDIFSNLYLAMAVEYYHNEYKSSKLLTKYIVDNLINENQLLINEIINNLGYERFILKHLINPVNSKNYESERSIFNEILNNEKILEEIKKNIYVKNNILADLELAGSDKLDINSEEYKSLKNRIINVDEFKN